MIYTVTLNPAIDITIYLNRLEKGQINRSNGYVIDAGGKGINVSKVIKVLGEESVALGFLGKENSGWFLEYLQRFSIENDFVFVNGLTRTNIKIVELGDGQHTDLNQPGFEITEIDKLAVFEKIESKARYGDIFVLSGSLPTNADSKMYFEIIKSLKQKGVTVIFDADGQALKEGIKAKPDVIKPNIHEFKTLFNVDESDTNSIVKAAKSLVAEGIKVVLISLGANGSIFVTENLVLYAKPLKVDVKSTTGAGDSMVAAIAYGFSKKMSKQQLFKLACACATAKVVEEGNKPPEMKQIDYFFENVEIERLG
ncbi:fructose-1-phosphate kinase [Fervidobacterium changbaicum]|uniref:1-phosphofructokinase n=1 Tax=Fervidobacterium changbaicum TaxID=310769 RepID=A0ABX5QSW3_9BACT|nr:1-phosphofructokinase [Fervidobacterium changbaicum]QAV33195.1 1-phosphofructokinase [Fervidobacterium changbaicum]SDH70375.1 fructose-1-phosphate kinase [Fervidobacterium changbaicum]